MATLYLDNIQIILKIGNKQLFLSWIIPKSDETDLYTL
jgi:hypothetical protein